MHLAGLFPNQALSTYWIAFVQAGFNLIDTADVYSTWVRGNNGGESETIIGRWLRKRNNRKDIVLATKVGKLMGPGKTAAITKIYPSRLLKIP
jgi:aryl-alcohol dehydrogenase-like predicted oxidoreductase